MVYFPQLDGIYSLQRLRFRPWNRDKFATIGAKYSRLWASWCAKKVDYLHFPSLCIFRLLRESLVFEREKKPFFFVSLCRVLRLCAISSMVCRCLCSLEITENKMIKFPCDEWKRANFYLHTKCVHLHTPRFIDCQRDIATIYYFGFTFYAKISSVDWVRFLALTNLCGNMPAIQTNESVGPRAIFI